MLLSKNKNIKHMANNIIINTKNTPEMIVFEHKKYYDINKTFIVVNKTSSPEQYIINLNELFEYENRELRRRMTYAVH